MKVLYISTSDYRYGAPKSLLTLMEELKNHYEVEPILLTKKRNLLNEKCDELGIKNFSFYSRDIMSGSQYESSILNRLKHLYKRMQYCYGAITMKQIEKAGLNFEEIDLIHSNSNRLDMGCYLSKKYKKPHIWHLREMNAGCKRMVYYKRNCMKYMNDNADLFIAISQAVKSQWVQDGLNASKIKVVYNGIKNSYAEGLLEVPEMKKTVKIVMVGRIEPEKGQEQLLQSVAQLPESVQQCLEIDLIGESYMDYKRKLYKIHKTLCPNVKIQYLGYQANIPEKLKEYHIGVNCSGSEAFGRTTIEYLLAGLLVIAADSGANPELIEHEISGYLYKYANIEDMSKQILKAFYHRDHWPEIINAGKKKAQSEFCEKKYADNVYNVYTLI